MNTTVTIAPTAEPVSLDEAKEHLRITHDQSDDYIQRLITAVRQEAEAYLNGAIMAQTLTGHLNQFSDVIPLPSNPILGVASVQYVDQDGATQTLDSGVYDVDLANRQIIRGYDQSWPSIQPQINAVTIVFTAGYASASQVPEAIKQAILLRVGEFFIARDESSRDQNKTTLTMERLLTPYRGYH